MTKTEMRATPVSEKTMKKLTRNSDKIPLQYHLITTGESITDASYDAIKDKEYIDLDVLMQVLPLIDKRMKACPNCNSILTITYDNAGKKVIDCHCDQCGFKGGC